MNGDRLVEGYLRQLDVAARPLSAGRRRELVADVREHIDEDLARGGRRDEVAVRNVLERLGPPEAIVAAEVGPIGVDAPEAIRTLRALEATLGTGEVMALVLLTIGAVVAPVIGPAVGLVLTWASGRWSVSTKVAITLVAVVLLVVPIVLLGAVTPSGVGPSR